MNQLGEEVRSSSNLQPGVCGVGRAGGEGG